MRRLLCPRKLQFCTDFSANMAHALPRSPGTLQCPSLRYLTGTRKSAGQTPESGHFRLFCPREGQFRAEFSANMAHALPCTPGDPQCRSLRYLTGGRKFAGQMTETGHFRLFCLCKRQFRTGFSPTMPTEFSSNIPLLFLCSYIWRSHCTFIMQPTAITFGHQECLTLM